MRRRDNFVARLHAQGTHCDVKRVCAISTGNAVLHAQSFSPGVFKTGDVRPADESRLSNHLADGGINFRFDAQILSMQINKGYFHGRLLSCRSNDFAKQPGRIAHINAGASDVFGHDSASSDAHVITDRDRKDGGIRPDIYMVTKLCWPPKIMISSSRASAKKKIINKHRPMRN